MFSLTTAQQNELEKGYVSIVYFVELQFASGTLRFNSSNRHFDWDTYTWLGTGELGGIGEIRETENVESSTLELTLNLADPSILGASLLSPEAYRGKPVILRMCPVANNALVDTPITCWTGTMDVMALALGADNGTISLRCVPTTQRLNRAATLRLNHATHQRNYPAELGFEYLNDLIAKPQTWASKKFQLSIT